MGHCQSSMATELHSGTGKAQGIGGGSGAPPSGLSVGCFIDAALPGELAALGAHLRRH